MFCAYVDESYTAKRYYIAAAVGDDQHWACVAEKMQEIRTRTSAEHGVPENIEYHAYELMSGDGDWSPLRGKHREAVGIYLAVLRAARECNIKFILRGVDVDLLHARYRYPDQPHSIVLGHLLERVHERARDFHSSAAVTVVADEIATQSEHLAQFEGYQSVGTPGYRSSTLSTIQSMRFASSAAELGLQIADFGAYLHRRRETHAETHPAAVRAMRRLTAELDAMTIHNITWMP